MKRLASALASTFLTLTTAAAYAQSFTPTITQTVGTGSNTSYFVLNFDDGPNGANNTASDYVFAYRWDYGANNTAPTGEDMISAFNQYTMPLLQISQTYSSSFGDYTVDSISYASYSQAGNYSKNQSYWEYWESTGARLSQNPADWEFANTGPLERLLTPNSYDARTFTQNGSDPVPVTPQAAPEPTSVSVLVVGAAGVVLLAVGRKRRAGSLS